MYTVIVENAKGQQLDLNKNYHTEITGLTPPNASVNMSKVSGVDGSQFNSAAVNSRNIVLTIYPKQPVEVNRLRLYDYFLVGQTIKIYYKNGLRNVYTEGYVETIDGTFFTNREALQISILCPDPYFKGAGEIVADISKLVSLFEFPFAIDVAGIPLSEFNEYLIGQITNDGNVSTGLVIELTANGTVVNPVIYDADTRDSMGLRLTMQANDLIRITTIKGKTGVELIRGGLTTNIINTILDDATWFQARPGTNFYTYIVDDGLDNLSVKFMANALYSGV